MSEQTAPAGAAAYDGASPAQIEADIEATRARLAGTVDELAVRMHPKEISRRSVQGAKTRMWQATHTPEGALRVERIAAVGAAVAALVTLMVWRKRHH